MDNSNVSNEHSVPIPSDVSAAFRTLGEAFQRMRMYRSGEGPLDGMIESLFEEADMPPKEVKGVSQGFLDGESYYPRCGLGERMRTHGWGTRA